MDWSKVLQIKRYTESKKVFEILGKPIFKMRDRSIYYMGEGFLLSYCEKQFKIEGTNRIEYGSSGEYLLNIYFFLYKQELESYFKLKQDEYNFGSEPLGQPFTIIGEISIGSQFKEVSKLLRLQYTQSYYQEGETRTLNNGKFIFQNKYIIYNNYTFLFYGKPNNTKLSAFEFTFI